MGFNKRFVNYQRSISALEGNGLKNYYGKSDCLIFEDQISSDIYKMFKDGKTESEILEIIKKNMEEKTYEVY